MSGYRSKTTPKLESDIFNTSQRERKVTLSQSKGRHSNVTIPGGRLLSAMSKSSNRALKVPVRMYDEHNIDITPVSLLDSEKQRSKEPTQDLSNDLTSQSSVPVPQQFTAGSSQSGQYHISLTRYQPSVGSASEDVGSEISEEMPDAGNLQQATEYTERKTVPEVIPELTSDELNSVVAIPIKETETIWMFEIAPISFVTESELGQKIVEKNEKYQNLIKARVGNDRYVEKGMVTFNDFQLSKVIQTEKINFSDNGINVTSWEMYDDIQNMAESDKPAGGAPNADTLNTEEEGDNPESTPSVPPQNTKMSSLPDKQPGISDTVTTSGESDVFGIKELPQMDTAESKLSKDELILRSEAMYQSLFVMERALYLNTYQEKLAVYRDLPTVEEILSSHKEEAKPPRISNPHIELLWQYSASITKGRNVACMAINKHNSDILAVGYGQYEFNEQKSGGMVCCWSAKNVEYAERVFHLESGVTSLDWSKTHPNLLAVGCYNGLVYMFDVRKHSDEPVIDTIDSPNRHLGPVRQVQWVVRESGGVAESQKVEVLVSASSDGSITQWSIRKGLESAVLMKLKRVSMTVPGEPKKKSDALISRYDGGVSIAFNHYDSNIYMAGTESGLVHRCSCSYNEQFLETYTGHTAPVYAIQWSPFSSDIFLSCSADWTIKLWSTDRQSSIINFSSSAKAVNCISWSPKSSVVFASVNDGAIEVWNLQISTLDPVIVEKLPECTVTSVQFAENSESIYVGDSIGNVGVYKLNSMPKIPKNQAEALDRVVQSCLNSQLPK